MNPLELKRKFKEMSDVILAFQPIIEPYDNYVEKDLRKIPLDDLRVFSTVCREFETLVIDKIYFALNRIIRNSEMEVVERKRRNVSVKVINPDTPDLSGFSAEQLTELIRQAEMLKKETPQS
jgi:transcriptional antiterminator